MKKLILKTVAFTLVGAFVTTSIGASNLNVSAAKKQSIKSVTTSTSKLSKNKLVSKKSGKAIKGYVLYKGKIYRNGVLFSGTVNSLKYVKGLKTNATIKGIKYISGKKANKTYKGIKYVSGKKANKTINGILYVNGVKYSGTKDGYFYKAGKKATGVAKNGKLYVNGKLNKGNRYYHKKWYINATVDTAKNKAVAGYLAIKVMNEKTYTEASWLTYQAVVKANQLKITDPKITTERFIAATKAIKEAQSKLVKKSDEVKYAAVSPDFQNYANDKLKNKKTSTANYYYSAQLNADFIDKYSHFYDENMTPYFKKMFPSVNTNAAKPTFVFLGNEKEPTTFEFAQKFYGNSIPAYGWYHGKHNITVMTHMGFAPPYNNINTILLPHEYFHWLNGNVLKSSIPGWLNEGIAYNISWAMHKNTMNFMESNLYKDAKGVLQQNTNLPLSNMTAYNVFTGYVQGTFGQKKFEQLLIRSSKESFDTVFKDIYGKTVNDMYTEVKEKIK